MYSKNSRLSWQCVLPSCSECKCSLVVTGLPELVLMRNWLFKDHEAWPLPPELRLRQLVQCVNVGCKVIVGLLTAFQTLINLSPCNLLSVLKRKRGDT